MLHDGHRDCPSELLIRRLASPDFVAFDQCGEFASTARLDAVPDELGPGWSLIVPINRYLLLRVPAVRGDVPAGAAALEMFRLGEVHGDALDPTQKTRK